MIFQPCGMIGVLIQVLVRNEMMLPTHHAAKATEIAFNPIRVLAIQVAVGFTMVDAARLKWS